MYRDDLTKGYHVPAIAYRKLGLKGVEKDVYSLIWTYTNKGGALYSNKWFIADALNVSKSSVENALKDLIKRGLIDIGNEKFKAKKI